MHKLKVLYFREPEVHATLLRQLSRKGYRIYPKVRLADVIARDRDEWMAERYFQYLLRAHLDFVVTKDDTAVFAVEFDGLHHLQDPATMERDAIKNCLCRVANLPMLRITSTEISPRDGLTILDYMLMRYVAWQEEIDGIQQEIREFAAGLGPEANPEDLAVDLDPTFHFDLRHPFPGSTIVRERLWRNYRIAWEMERSRHPLAEFICDSFNGRSGQLHHDQFYTCEARASVWHAGSPRENQLFSENVSVTLRSWLPLQANVPQPKLSCLFSALKAQDPEDAVRQFKIRIESMWFPDLPGISVSDIGENYAEYLGFRAVERWAKTSLRPL